MTSEPPKPARNMIVRDIADIRVDIDRVDTAFLSLIAERLELAAAVRRAKSGARVWRPSREDSHVRDLARAATDASPLLVSRIWAELMSASLALQGPMRLHVALEGDAIDVSTLVRDRFGAALPVLSYPTASSALAAAYAEEEGVAILPTPGGMNSWWTALCDGGAMPDMHVLAGLPRVIDTEILSATSASGWPRAVAVATADIAPSGADDSLLIVGKNIVPDEGQMLGEAGEKCLYRIARYIDPDSAYFQALKARDPQAKLIGCLPHPLS